MELCIVYRKISEVMPYERNPRRNDEAVDKVAESIRQFGFRVPIIIDGDGVIVAGHTRIKAAKVLGMTDVPCIIADDLTDEQIKAFRLADNKVGEFSAWDFRLLSDELADIADFGGVDMQIFGFHEAEEIDLDEFFVEAGEQKEKEPKRIQCPHCGELIEV